jgi:Domain of unknown function (DUF1877)
MGMVGCFRALPPEQIEELQLHPDAVVELMDFEDVDADIIDVDKAWHAIHYMLTGNAKRGDDEPASLAILGGVEVGGDIGYGPARLLEPQDVARVADYLEKLPPEFFAEYYNPEAMDAMGIYPEIWMRDGEEGLRYVRDWYQLLRTFYINSSKQNNGVLLWLS